VRYIDYSYWTALTTGTRRPTDAARFIRRGRRPGLRPHAHWTFPRCRRVPTGRSHLGADHLRAQRCRLSACGS
jgi:hypothetical protein